MSRAGRKTKRLKRPAAVPTSTLTVIDFIYRRLTGDEAGLALVGEARNDVRRSR